MDDRPMSRTDRVVDSITRMILDGELAAGDRLPVEAELAERLEVSRGSLREGVRALAGRTTRHRRWRGQAVPDADARAHAWHTQILDAVTRGHQDEARTLTQAHLLETERELP